MRKYLPYGCSGLFRKMKVSGKSQKQQLHIVEIMTSDYDWVLQMTKNNNLKTLFYLNKRFKKLYLHLLYAEFIPMPQLPPPSVSLECIFLLCNLLSWLGLMHYLTVAGGAHVQVSPATGSVSPSPHPSCFVHLHELNGLAADSTALCLAPCLAWPCLPTPPFYHLK